VVLLSTTAILVCDSQFLMLDVLFEATSAFGTVGLSRGITPYLGDCSRMVIILTMLVGRIGALTFMMGLLQKTQRKSMIKYPEGKLLIG
jgi:trk system potassium uptake protein TrkH